MTTWFRVKKAKRKKNCWDVKEGETHSFIFMAYKCQMTTYTKLNTSYDFIIFKVCRRMCYIQFGYILSSMHIPVDFYNSNKILKNDSLQTSAKKSIYWQTPQAKKKNGPKRTFVIELELYKYQSRRNGASW